MNENLPLRERFRIDEFDIASLEDEIRADQRCTDLLKAFAEALIADDQLEPAAAGTLAHGADLFLRDFLIAARRENIFRPHPESVRRFAGNWYIVNTLEPNRADIERQLAGIAAFYRYFAGLGLIEAELARTLVATCAELDYFVARIASFWEITGDGFRAWDQACPNGSRTT